MLTVRWVGGSWTDHFSCFEWFRLFLAFLGLVGSTNQLLRDDIWFFFTSWPLYQHPLMQEPISLKRDDDDDNGMQGPISLKRDAASFSASVQHCTLRPLAGCTDLTGHRSFAIIIFQRQAKLPTADAFLIPTSSSSSSQSMWKMVLSNQWLRKGVERKKLLFFWILSKLPPLRHPHPS